MYIVASCLRLVSYPPSSCIYLSHVKRGLTVHCGAIKRNLAAHPIGWWFSSPSSLKSNAFDFFFFLKNQILIGKKKKTDLPSNLTSSALILKSASLSALLLMGMNKMVQETNKTKKSQTLSRSSRHHCRFTDEQNGASSPSVQALSGVTSPRRPRPLEEANVYRQELKCFPEGAAACEVESRVLEKTSGRDDSNNNPNNKPWYIIKSDG